MKDKNRSGQTAFGAATARLIEQYQPAQTRLFDDPVIKYISNDVLTFLLKFKGIRNSFVRMFNNKTQGIFGGLVCRTKYIDEKVRLALDNGVQQILILGAGLDTRAYRIDGMKKVKVFEIDLAAIQEIKRKKIKRHLGSFPSNVIYVPIDFNTQQLVDVLSHTTFNLTEPTLVIWEGVTQYITADAVKKTFGFIAKLPVGSAVIFTYILDDVIKKESTIKGANELMSFFESKNSSWIFGLGKAGVANFLNKYDLSLAEDVGAVYYDEKYLKPINRCLDVTAIERCAFALKGVT